MTQSAESKRLVAHEIARLRAIKPLNDVQLGELTRVCVEQFPTLQAVQRAVEHFLEVSEWLPTPRAMISFLRSLKAAPPRRSCDTCSGTGFVVKTVRRSTLHGPRNVEMAYRCRCTPKPPSDADELTEQEGAA